MLYHLKISHLTCLWKMDATHSFYEKCSATADHLSKLAQKSKEGTRLVFDLSVWYFPCMSLGSEGNSASQETFWDILKALTKALCWCMKCWNDSFSWRTSPCSRAILSCFDTSYGNIFEKYYLCILSFLTVHYVFMSCCHQMPDSISLVQKKTVHVNQLYSNSTSRNVVALIKISLWDWDEGVFIYLWEHRDKI